MAEFAEGPWNNFVFKLMKPEQKSDILKFLRDHLYYPAMSTLGYEKDMDDDFETLFNKLLDDMSLHFLVEDKDTGEIAAIRICIITRKGDPKPDFSYAKSEKFKDIVDFVLELNDTVDIFETFGVDKYTESFGICVHPKYKRLGIATEIYRRSHPFLKAHGYSITKVSFSSPHSRRAGVKNGFKELGRREIIGAKDRHGQLLNPAATSHDFLNMGVFQF